MNKINLIVYLAFYLAFVSCGTPREVRYVYVAPPQAEVAPVYTTPSQSYSASPAQSYSAPAAQTSYSYTNQYQEPTRTNAASPQRVKSQASIEDLANDPTVRGVLRGYGEATVVGSATAARSMALQQAKREVAQKAAQLIVNFEKQNIKTMGAAAQKYFSQIESGAQAIISNPRTLDYLRKENGASTTYYVCVEVSKEDIINEVRAAADAINAQDRQKLLEYIDKFCNNDIEIEK